jgi:glucosamine--fructose-6-phosphate aminotransferase (isomerizing)
MCGIVGYTGNQNAVNVLLGGLSKLEYRGYDSAGISVVETGNIVTYKESGKLAKLSKKLSGVSLGANIGIGHTRWATHGAPTEANAHPHGDKVLSLVHNGIIENYLSIKQTLLDGGVQFTTDTDTECAARLLSYNYEGDPVKALRKTLPQLKGEYTFVVIFKDFPEKIFACRQGSPLCIGIGKSENFIASDLTAFLEWTKNYILPEENDIAEVGKDYVKIFDTDGNEKPYEVKKSDLSVEAVQKAGYPHFMLKEIFEQPDVVSSTTKFLLENGFGNIEALSLCPKRVHIVACGTAYYAGMLGKNWIEKFARIPTYVHIASEFRYQNPILDENDLFIAVSQSGETADTREALKLAKSRGLKTVAIVNVVGSSIAREADSVVYTYAGPEISVASTKAYSVQLTALYLLAVQLGSGCEHLSEAAALRLIEDMKSLPNKASELLNSDVPDRCKDFAKNLKHAETMFFIGRGQDYALSLEGSLKLKEISYVHCEAYAAGELKHGPISLIQDGTPVVAICTDPELYEKTKNNIVEVKARGAKILLFCRDDLERADEIGDFVVRLPSIPADIMPLLGIIPLQLFAYHMACTRGCDVDQPRNLAKSVTVE